MGKRFLAPSHPIEQRAAFVRRVPMIRVELERMLKAQQRFGLPLQVDQSLPETGPQFGFVRLELHRLVERLEGIFDSRP